MGARTPTRQSYGDYFEMDLQSETRRSGRNFEEQSLISSPWLPSRRGYKDFSSVCCSYEHGRIPNGCEDYVSE
ncbi:hypothetical protein Tco_0225616, partial [Tanacetum coccineum]